MSLKIVKLFLLIEFLLINNLIIKAQFDEEYTETDSTVRKKSKSERFIFGGNFGLSVGTISSIEISPAIGYFLTERFIVNAGPLYEFYSNKYESISYSLFGFRLFLRYILIKNFYLHIENETQFLNKNLQTIYNIQSNQNIYTINNFLLGGGLRQPIGKKGGIYMSVLWYVFPVLDYLPKLRIEYMF